MKSKKTKKEKKKLSKVTTGQEDSQSGQDVQQDEMLQNLKSLPEDEFNTKFEKMLVSCIFVSSFLMFGHAGPLINQFGFIDFQLCL